MGTDVSDSGDVALRHVCNYYVNEEMWWKKYFVNKW